MTLGAEEELHLIDLERWQLAARAPQVLSRLRGAYYSAEIQRTTVETNTDVVSSLTACARSSLRLRKGLVEVAGRGGARRRRGRHRAPREFRDFELTATGRYGRMQEQYRLLVDEQLICGTQIHVGVSDRDLAVEITQRIAPTPARAARPLRQLALLERPGHRLRQHPHDHLAALAERRDRPARCRVGRRSTTSC